MPAPTSSSGQVYPDIEGYHLVHPIGGGGFSKVFRAVNSTAPVHKVAAVKVVSYARPSAHSARQQHPPDRRALQKEVQIHAVLKHASVLEFIAVKEIGLGKEGERAVALGNYVPGLYMVLEYAEGGDLFDKIPPDQGLEESLAHFYFHQLLSALEYIHGQGIAHRDVKPENLLLDAQGNLKLADFGLCSVYKYRGQERELLGACGSLPYIAPEMNGKPYKGEFVDVWSTGAVLFAMLVGNTPWDEPTVRSPEYSAYLTGELFKYDPWPRLSSDMLSLLRKMMCPDPRRRISIQGIKEHRWYTRPNSLLEDGKCRDPVTLAERLLQGLIVSGDLDFDLHSDGQRAQVPETISLTQPEWNERSADMGAMGDWRLAMPPSSAVASLGGEAVQARRARHEAMSQQIGARRAAFPGSTAEAGVAASQFTQAINHFTQFSSLAPASTRFSPHLTRFFCAAEPALVARLLVERLDALAVQNSISSMGDDESELLAAAAEAADAASMDGDGDVDMDMDGSAPAPQPLMRSSSGSLPAGAIGSRGARIRLGTTDRRKCVLKGEIRIETLAAAASAGPNAPKCLVFMRRSKGNPLEWRRLFRSLAGDVQRQIAQRTA